MESRLRVVLIIPSRVVATWTWNNKKEKTKREAKKGKWTLMVREKTNNKNDEKKKKEETQARRSILLTHFFLLFSSSLFISSTASNHPNKCRYITLFNKMNWPGIMTYNKKEKGNKRKETLKKRKVKLQRVAFLGYGISLLNFGTNTAK